MTGLVFTRDESNSPCLCVRSLCADTLVMRVYLAGTYTHGGRSRSGNNNNKIRQRNEMTVKREGME